MLLAPGISLIQIVNTTIYLIQPIQPLNNLVHAPLPPEWYPHFGDTTITQILWRIAQKLLTQFS